MKKNKMMRIAGVLLIAVLLTTSLISGTFAKYVTRGEVEDHARVAKFGVVITGDGSLFAKNHYSVISGSSNQPAADGTADEYDIVLTVESSNDDQIVAPGTKNTTGMTISVTGKPEVDVNVTLDVTIDKDVFLGAMTGLPDMTTGNVEDTFDNEEDYYPVVYTLTKNGTVVTSGTLADIKDALEGLSGYYDANTDLATEIGELTITWEWEFELVDFTEVENAAEADWAARMEDHSTMHYKGEKYYKDPSTSKGQLGKDDYIAARKADAKNLRDQKDTLLGDLATQDFGPEEITFAPVLPADLQYNLTTSIAISVTVTQVD